MNMNFEELTDAELRQLLCSQIELLSEEDCRDLLNNHVAENRAR